MGLRLPVVIVEDEDGGHHAGGHHEHDGVEICGLIQSIWSQFTNDSWCLPMSGLFDVIGMMDDTVFRNMVRDSKIVTPKRQKKQLFSNFFYSVSSLIKISLCYDD